MKNKLICPNCKALLKQEGDSEKAEGEFRKYESIETNKHRRGNYILIECLKCFVIAKVQIWDAFNK